MKLAVDVFVAQMVTAFPGVTLDEIRNLTALLDHFKTHVSSAELAATKLDITRVIGLINQANTRIQQVQQRSP